jgi:hypothetical protein
MLCGRSWHSAKDDEVQHKAHRAVSDKADEKDVSADDE